MTRLLILGGTRFVGRHIAEGALARGWELTLFNRGLDDPGAFPEAQNLRGDRDGGLEALSDGRWDVVVDTSGYVPGLVRDSADLLTERAEHYVFVSSASVYADKGQVGITEDAPVAALDDAADYGALKAACEGEVRAVFGDRCTIIRPGLIVGPQDPTNRFTYWVTRIARGGDVLAPEPRNQPVQVIDARDLAEWTLHVAEERIAGVFNAVGEITTMESVLAEIARVAGSDARLCWTPEQRLLDAGVEAWSDLPLWLAPGANPAHRGFLSISNARAVEAGLTLRPLEQTIGDTLAWAPASPAGPAGLDPEVEQRLLGG